MRSVAFKFEIKALKMDYYSRCLRRRLRLTRRIKMAPPLIEHHMREADCKVRNGGSLAFS